jgi:penicillin-binding protein 1B
VLRLTAVAFMLVVAYGGYLAWTATSEFEGRRWDIPAQVYAAPLELYVGRAPSCPR